MSDDGFAIFMSLVEHPLVPNPEDFRACSVVLQRAVAIWDGEHEDLLLRSFFHSASDDDHAVNFVPTGAVQMSFRSDNVWFPLELTTGIPEPEALVVLDILTPEPVDDRWLPRPFELAGRSRLRLGLQRYDVARVTAALRAEERNVDFRFRRGSGSQ
jgi:hypothetical protein